jgi:hypothetical protein
VLRAKRSNRVGRTRLLRPLWGARNDLIAIEIPCRIRYNTALLADPLIE